MKMPLNIFEFFGQQIIQGNIWKQDLLCWWCICNLYMHIPILVFWRRWLQNPIRSIIGYSTHALHLDKMISWFSGFYTLSLNEKLNIYISVFIEDMIDECKKRTKKSLGKKYFDFQFLVWNIKVRIKTDFQLFININLDPINAVHWAKIVSNQQVL